jgi:glycosyltransferase involved in cell wall biosynthesis
MRRVLVLYNYHHHYRVPFFLELSKKVNLTVLHSGKSMELSDSGVKEIVVPDIKFGPFHWQPKVIKEIKSNNYDFVIMLFDVAWIANILSFFFFRRKNKFILWGAWKTKSSLANKLRLIMMERSFSNVFYHYSAMNEFIDDGLPREKAFVANNTFDVGTRTKSYLHEIKNKILFVGSLDKRKELDVLLKSFVEVIGEIPKEINLSIVGDGVEREGLIEIVESLNLADRDKLEGRINDPQKLVSYYNEAIVNISYGQAGLSVLQSFGYGVPFVTKSNAISGGEKLNIINGHNGFLCKDQSELKEIIVSLCNNMELARSLGEKAYNYYSDYCSIENMVQGFMDSIELTRHSRIDEKV